jgi:calcineurin-like phosphoesterase family protein
LTQERLRTLYLDDLKQLVSYEEKKFPKVKNYNAWKKIPSILKETTTQKQINPFGDNDVWCWSDLHFNHANIIKYSTRPFPDKETMNQCLIDNYCKVVKPQDICIFGGDIGFMKEEAINNILDQLPGYKILVLGNHDLHRDGTPYDLHFDQIDICLFVELNISKVQLLFTHYPLDNVPENSYNIHGHTHRHNMPGNKHFNISVEQINYTPINLKDIVAQIPNETT